VITFNTPCLRWKLVAAVKLQYGWPGFTAPYSTRYLSKLVTISSSPTFGFTPGAWTDVQQQLYTMDHEGNISPNDGLFHINADFPYGAPLTEDPKHSESWEVTETYFKHIYNNGLFFTQTEVQLSDPYELTALESDADQIIASLNLADQPWNTWQSGGDLTSIAAQPIENNAIPEQFRNAAQDNSGPAAMTQLNSAAWYAYALGLVTASFWQPNGYMKTIGHVAMAGNYCRKTFVFDPSFNVLNQNCLSGIGSCASTFIVTPPPLVAGQNAVVLIVPNCQCNAA
jgi:hypothetical protein